MPYIPQSLVGFALSTLGDIIIGVSVLRVHLKVRREKKIDDLVRREISQERYLIALGIMLVIIGFILEIPYKL